jgi:6-pyruvoyltetrahydropterin/6-carboxytetrahydropterin synthase
MVMKGILVRQTSDAAPKLLSVKRTKIISSDSKQNKNMKKLAVYRKEHFNAAHRLHNDTLSDALNLELFGKCNNPNYHGHNYELVVKLVGEVNPKTGYVYDTKELSKLLKDHVLERFDHKNLNLDVPEFKSINPTAENIVLVIYDILRAQIDTRYELNLRLYETERNFVEYPA